MTQKKLFPGESSQGEDRSKAKREVVAVTQGDPTRLPISVEAIFFSLLIE